MIKQRAVSVLIYLSTYIYYCDEQDPERLTNIFFFFFFYNSIFSRMSCCIANKTRRNKDYSASQSLLRKIFFFCVEIF